MVAGAVGRLGVGGGFDSSPECAQGVCVLPITANTMPPTPQDAHAHAPCPHTLAQCHLQAFDRAASGPAHDVCGAVCELARILWHVLHRWIACSDIFGACLEVVQVGAPTCPGCASRPWPCHFCSTRSFTLSLSNSITLLLIQSFTHSCSHSFTRLFAWLLARLLTCLFIR